MSSILTNTGAMTALQTLKGINKNLGGIQNQISTGKSVATAKDNSALWAISKVMESDVQGFKAVSQSLSLGESTVAVARGAAEAVTDTLKLMKEEIVAAQDGTVDRGKIQDRVDALRGQIESTTAAAQLNGVNLVQGTVTGTGATATSTAPESLSVTSSLNRSAGTPAGADPVANPAVAASVSAAQITVDGQDLSTVAIKGQDAAGNDVNLASIDVSTAEGAKAALEAIDGMIEMATNAGAAFGSDQSRIETQSAFVDNLTDSMKAGIGSLVDADMEEASARLQALQTQQQLGVQSLSIANQAPQSILSLFR